MQRSDERTRVVDVDVAVERGEGDRRDDSAGRRFGVRRRLGVGRRLGRVFSVRAFLATLALTVVGLVLFGLVPVVGGVGRFVGIFLATFVVGLLGAHRRYLESALAGGITAGAGFLLSALGTVLFPVVAQYGVEIAGVGATAGVLVALAGHYFGRDLRAGLTRDVE